MNIILFDQVPEDGCIPVSDFRGEHIVKVLHLVPGDQFLLGELQGRRGKATVVSVTPERVVFEWEPQEDAAALHPVTLLVAQVRPICMKRILREAVSLGVREIIVTGADTAERSYQDAKLWSTGEYRKYLLDGAMQSGYTGISELRFASRVENLKEDFSKMDNLVLLDNVLEGSSLADFSYAGGSVLLAVGPERGWSARERQVLVDSGFSSYSLGKRVLRTETACSAGTAVLLGRMGLL